VGAKGLAFNGSGETFVLIDSELRAAMADFGIDPGGQPLNHDGHIHRFRGPDDRRGSKNCWYVIYDNAAVFGSWKLNFKTTWHPQESRYGRLSKAEQRGIKEEIKAADRRAEAERAKLQADVAEKAKLLWGRAAPISDPAEHEYLLKKSVQAHGARRSGHALVIPVRDVVTGDIFSLQYISKDGEKTFLPGGRVAGCYYLFGDAGDDRFKKIAIVEGFATGAAVQEATGLPTAVAFNCGNLLEVARALHKKHSSADILICADDDRETKGNPGLTKAREAAAAVNGQVVVPQFPEGVEAGTDFNDLAAVAGIEAVRNQMMAVVDSGIPPNFKLTKDALYIEKELSDRKDGKTIVEEPVCSRLEVIALTRDEKGGNWGRLLRYPDPDGREHQWSMPMEMLAGDGREYRGRLLEQGLKIYPTLAARHGLTARGVSGHAGE
jgi:putative DNA primase/helicase